MNDVSNFKMFVIVNRNIWKILSNMNRIDILYELYEHKSLRFSDIMFSLKMNPKLVKEHLNCLINLNAVEKEENRYTLTDYGKSICEIKVKIK